MRRKKKTRKRRRRKKRRRQRKKTRKKRRRRKRGERMTRRRVTEMRVRVKLRGRQIPGAMNQKAARDVRAMRAKVVPARMAFKVPERRATMGVITVSRTQNPEIQLFVAQ